MQMSKVQSHPYMINIPRPKIWAVNLLSLPTGMKFVMFVHVYCATLLSCSLHHSSEGIPDYICFYILGCQGILLYQQGLLICKIVFFFFLFKLHWAVDDFSPVTIEGSPYQCLRG